MRLTKIITAFLLSSALLAASLTGCVRSAPYAESAAVEIASASETVAALMARSARKGIQTILVVSLSSYDPISGAEGFRNGSWADMLMLMVIDKNLGKATALHVNPDTLVPFKAPGTSETIEIPLGEVYSYGSGGSDSCISQMKAVSNLLDGVKIDHYMIFAQGAIGIVNDTLGGLELEAPEDFSEKYPEFEQGEYVHLTGERAVTFFCYRDVGDDSNELHMARQRQFMAALYGPLTRNMQQDGFLTKLTMQLGDRLDTDLALSQMVQLMEVMESCQLDETILTLPGSLEQKNGQYGYRVKADGVSQLVEFLFY